MRVTHLNSCPTGTSKHAFVLYWMQSSMRTICNPPLEFAVQSANTLNLPLVVCFSITPKYPQANLRHYAFLLQGLKDIQNNLSKRKITFLLSTSHPPHKYPTELANKYQPSHIVLDMSYLRAEREWVEEFVEGVKGIRVSQVEGESAVPVRLVSDKCEFAARTIRPKIYAHLKEYLVLTECIEIQNKEAPAWVDGERKRGLDAQKWEEILDSLEIEDRSVAPVSDEYYGGEEAAHGRLKTFLGRLDRYATERNNPSIDGSSRLSQYLHFGHISPVECALAAQRTSRKNAQPFIEELIVRRELSFNHCFYNSQYESLSCLPDWAKKTMDKHKHDPRSYVYSLQQFEKSQTHDKYWNASQKELTITGRMPNYLRMYWGKKILEWTATYTDAWNVLVYLNNKYEIDGRDPNSWCNFAWIFGAKDRPWTERPVFGQLRYMNSEGLRRKFDMENYVARVRAIRGKGPLDKFLAPTRHHDQEDQKPSKRRRSSVE